MGFVTDLQFSQLFNRMKSNNIGFSIGFDSIKFDWFALVVLRLSSFGWCVLVNFLFVGTLVRAILDTNRLEIACRMGQLLYVDILCKIYNFASQVIR